LRVKDRDYYPMVVVANKCDLEHERQVSTQGTSNALFIERLIGRREGVGDFIWMQVYRDISKESYKCRRGILFFGS